MSPSPPTCVVTGATGYVGGRICNCLQAAGWKILRWSRSAGTDGAKFQLGQEVDPESFGNVNALVHCAYDFSARNWDEIVAANVRGSEKLLRAARTAGIERLVFISSASAFDGCHSQYGRAKLEIEGIAQSLGSIIVRPGLVYGDHPGGVFGGLVKQAVRSSIVPLMGGGHQRQYLVHDADLGAFVLRSLTGAAPAAGPVLVAHEKPWTMRQLLERIAAAAHRKPVFLPVPWRAVWLGLKTMEALYLPAPFRSDSVIGLIHQNPRPSFEALKSLGFECRPFSLTPEMVA